MTIGKFERVLGEAPPTCPCGPRCESCGRDDGELNILRAIVLRAILDGTLVEFCVTACTMCYGVPSNFRLQASTIRMITAAHAAKHRHVKGVTPIAGAKRASAG